MIIALFVAQAPVRTRALTDKIVKRIAGGVSFQSSASAQAQPVTADQVIPDEGFVITDQGGVADLVMPDSSVIRIAQAARIKVGAFSEAGSGKDNYITVYNGAFRFKIQHPAGGVANYRFVTPTSQIAVRGTEGLGKVGADQTQVSCTLATNPDDVRVAAVKMASYVPSGASPNELKLFLRGGDPYDEVALSELAPEPRLIAQVEIAFTALAQGFTATVTVNGIVVGQFVLSAAALGVGGTLSAISAAGSAAITAGTTAAAGAATGTAVITGAAAAAAAGALAVAASKASSGVSTATPSPTPTVTVTATPTPTATVTASPTPTATVTVAPTVTATATATATSTATATPTPTPSVSRVPTMTPGPTATPLPTVTPRGQPTRTIFDDFLRRDPGPSDAGLKRPGSQRL